MGHSHVVHVAIIDVVGYTYSDSRGRLLIGLQLG